MRRFCIQLIETEPQLALIAEEKSPAQISLRGVSAINCSDLEVSMVKVNGEIIKASGKTILEMLEDEGYDSKKVVVELNLMIIPKEDYDKIIIKENDSIEVLSFVGGG